MPESATILLVEDDRALLDGIADLLEISNIGYEIQVFKALDGREALRVLDRHTPDLIITDIMMPRMGGFEFLEHVRRTAGWIHIPVIFLTARGSDSDVLRGRFSGAELYITKPYDADEFLQLVSSQLSRTFELDRQRHYRMHQLGRQIVQLLNHEFRTPLTYLTAYSDMLADGYLSEDAEILHEYLNGIRVGVDRMGRLVRDLITVMELRTGEAIINFNRNAQIIENLNDVLQPVCQRYQVRGAEVNIPLTWRFPDGLPPVFGDRVSLADAFARLLDNAIKFTSKKDQKEGDVLVAADADQDEIRLSVTDNGIGFPLEVESDIFTLFYQHNRDQIEQQGAGTGLTIAKGITELHGGRIEVESEEGRGSTFKLILPRFQESVAHDGWRTASYHARRTATILLVEDEQSLLRGLRDLLEVFEGKYRLNILTALDGTEGLRILSQQQPDLIVSDIRMPRMDGYEFLSAVRQNPAWVHIPFIFLTAMGDRQDVIKGRSSGVEEYITKPYDANELFGVIVAQLDRKFQRQRVLDQDFEALKRSVLALLLTDIDIPLESLSVYTDTLSANLSMAQSEKDLTRYLRGIQVGSSQVSWLVEDYIFLAGVRAGEAKVDVTLMARPTDVNTILWQVGNFRRLHPEWMDLIIVRDLGPSLPPIIILPDKLAMCLERLSATVLRSSSSDQADRLFLVSRHVDDQVKISVSAYREVYTAEETQLIEELLARSGPLVDDLMEIDPRLLVAKAIVDLHGGEINIEKNTVLGCSFVLSFPASNIEFTYY